MAVVGVALGGGGGVGVVGALGAQLGGGVPVLGVFGVVGAVAVAVALSISGVK